MREKTPGPDHPDTLGSMFDLARDNRDHGRLDGAESLFRSVVKKRAEVFGEDDNEISCVASKAQAKQTPSSPQLAEAEVNTIVGFGKNVVRNHAFMLIRLCSLTLVYAALQRYLKAAQLLKKPLEGLYKSWFQIM